MMYFLMKVEANRIINAGTSVAEDEEAILWDAVSVKSHGRFWDGDKIFYCIGDEYKPGDTTVGDIYDISYQIFAIGNDLFLCDEIDGEFNDLFEGALISHWQDLTQPLDFLMRINTEEIETYFGIEYDTTINVVRVLESGDFTKLA